MKLRIPIHPVAIAGIWRTLTALPAVFSILALALALFGTALEAQTFYGSVVGNVTDPTGAAISGAKVTLIDVGTGDKREAESDSAGAYRFVSLVPANYRLEIEKSGFKRVSRAPIAVRVESAVRIDVAMDLGSLAETIEVQSTTPLLQTESGAVSDMVEGSQVQEMPLNGRNSMNLLSITPSVVAGTPQGNASLNVGTHTNTNNWGDYAIGGGLAGTNAMYLDGGPVNILMQNNTALIPAQEAVQEFRVASNSISPEFGRFGGGAINMTTRSGSNAFHGSAYEYLKNADMNANNFFLNANNQPRAEWTQNQYGARLGGPIKKDRLFFFFSWEAFHSRLGVPGNTNVPSLNLRNGLFTKAITDPRGRGGCVTQPSAGLWQISPSCIDPTAQYMLTYFPLPNSTSPLTNFLSTPVTGNNGNQYTARGDYNLSEKQRLFGRWSWWPQVDLPYNTLQNFTKNAYSNNSAIQAVLGDTYTINPSTILDVRLAYLRAYTDNTPPTLGADLTPFGPAYAQLQTQTTVRYVPAPHINGPYGIFGLNGMTQYSANWLNSYDAAASVTKIMGHHSLKAGLEIRLSDNNTPGSTGQATGIFTFTGGLSGDSFADFLFGTPANGAITTLSPVATYNYYKAFYVTDQWQVGRKLTVNIGARYELPGAEEERHDRATVLLPNTVDPVTNVKGTLALVNSSLYSSRYLIQPKNDLVAPRIGVAYRLTNSTVIRGGFGITYLPPDMSGGVQANSSPVANATTSFLNAPNGPLTLLSNPFPNGILQPYGRTNPNWIKTRLGQSLSGPYPFANYPRAEQYNLSIGHQFHSDLLIEAGFVGSRGSNLPVSNIGLDELTPQYWTPAGEIQANRPFGANYQNVVNAVAFVGVSNYNSLQARIQKRFRNNSMISANYTFSKALSDMENGGNGATANPTTGGGLGYGIQDYNNIRGAEYSLSSFDTRQRVILNFVTDLPFGQGKRYANFSGLAGALVSGWALNGITTLQKGFPLPITQAASGNLLTNNFGYGQLRPNVIAGCNKVVSGSAQSRLNGWFNAACFTPVNNYAIGDEARSDPNLRAPGIANWDMSLVKNNKIWESVDLQFRAEVFNAFNRVQFAAPNNQIDGANFGKVIGQSNVPRTIQLSLRLNF